MAPARIVAVDDEEQVLELLRHTLEPEGYELHCARDAAGAAPLLDEVQPDLVILDVALPDGNGLDLTRDIRRSSDVPIIILSARTEEVDRVLGLELGADDYVAKPFSPREFVIRVRAILRRSARETTSAEKVSAGDLVIDMEAHQAYVDRVPVHLTLSEFRLLSMLASAPGRAYSRVELLTVLGEAAEAGDERAVDAHIHNIRTKIEVDPARPRYVLTVRGYGYRLGR